MNEIEIEWLSDAYDGCYDCGTSWAEGAIVKLDGKTILELIPVAHCFGGDDWSEAQVYKEIIKKLGYQVKEG